MLSNAVCKLDIKSWRLESLANEMLADNRRLCVRRKRRGEGLAGHDNTVDAKSFVSSPRRDETYNK